MSVNLLPILFKRQIPDHIKSAYPLFVDFLKAYQEFLSQTQAQELEKFRDIDTVTEEFIERFKAELAYNIPLDDLQDKRMFLKNLREFYLSRGSEASYKFIFKTFFNKDVEIFYPSRQMLRVSDGKWKQDVSIFVQNTSSTASSLFPLSGNYIAIDSGGKKLTSYVENVVQYSNNIFEVFIQRDIVKSMEVGAKISFTEGAVEYTGTVLLAPKSIKILKRGKGFRVGDVFNLKTNIGEGCAVKVTQVDGTGGIVKAKILKFSLDYSTNFWSYLSSRDGAIPVPQSFSESGDIQTLTLSNVVSDNINEAGIISKQDYMFYDTSIPVGSETQGASRFFADTSYVGQVYSQIYADNLTDYNPEDLAVIEVQVGACSIYSGYYLAQDGFISDEIYIQDSNYYQAFSYVIKVEEELRKYSDLVKTILHPAGMKMFAEFQVYNNINISATSIFKNRVIQLSDSFTVFNQGVTYSDYDVTFDINGENIIHTPKLNASIILSPFNTLSYVIGKRLVTEFSTTSSTVKFVGKNIPDSPYSIDEEYPVKFVEKPFYSELQVQLQSLQKILEKPISTSTLAVNTTNTLKTVTKPITSQTSSIESTATKLFAKYAGISYYDISSSATKSVDKALISSPYAMASVINEKKLETIFPTEDQSIVSLASRLFSLNTDESIYQVNTEEVDVVSEKRITDTYNLSSILQPIIFGKSITTSIGIQDPLGKTLIFDTIDDDFNITETFNYINGALRGFSSDFSVSSIPVDSITKTFSGVNFNYNFQDSKEILNITKGSINLSYAVSDTPVLSSLLPFSDGITSSSVSNKSYQKTLSQLSVTIGSSITAKNATKSITSPSSILDTNSLTFIRGTVNESTIILDDQFTYLIGALREFSSQFNLTSAINNKSATKTLPQLTITTSSAIASRQQNKIISSGASVDDSGVLKLNSYDSGDYFYPNAIDYQNDVVSIT